MLSAPQMKGLISVSKTPGAGAGDIRAYLVSQLGAEYEKLEQATVKQILGFYETAEKEVASHPIFSKVGPLEQIETVSARMGELLREQYAQVMGLLDTEIAKGLESQTNAIGLEAKESNHGGLEKKRNAKNIQLGING
jgi:hypothetical protein